MDGNSRLGESNSLLICIFKRLFIAAVILFLGMSLVFVLLYAGPLNPAKSVAGLGATPTEIQQIRERLGLTAPLVEQYIDFMMHRFTLDFGQSWTIAPDASTAPEPAAQQVRIGERLLRTLWLWGWALLIAYAIGIPLGLHAGRNPESWSGSLVSSGGIISRAAAICARDTSVGIAPAR